MVTAYTRTNTLHGHCAHCACAACALHTTSAEQVGRAALKLLEVVPGLSVWELLMREWEGRDVNQIGRQPPLSSNKAASHFPRLKQATGAPPGGRQAAHTHRPSPSHLDQPPASLGHLLASLGPPRSAPPLSLRQPRPVGRRARAHALHRGGAGHTLQLQLQAPATGICSRRRYRLTRMLRSTQVCRTIGCSSSTTATGEHERVRE